MKKLSTAVLALALATPLFAQTSQTDVPSNSATTAETKSALKQQEKTNKAQAKADKAQRKALNTKEQKKADKAQDKADRTANPPQ